MKIKSIKDLNIPKEIKSILSEEEYWIDEFFEPITITVQEIQYKRENMISFQADFEVLDEYQDIDGNDWQELINIYIGEKEPELLKFIKGDSEGSTCVIWTNNESNFKKILGRLIELIENKKEVYRIKKEAGR